MKTTTVYIIIIIPLQHKCIDLTWPDWYNICTDLSTCIYCLSTFKSFICFCLSTIRLQHWRFYINCRFKSALNGLILYISNLTKQTHLKVETRWRENRKRFYSCCRWISTEILKRQTVIVKNETSNFLKVTLMHF